DDRHAELGGEGELALEQHALRLARRVVAEVVEAGLADRDRTVVAEQAPQLAEICGRARFVWMDAEAGIDPFVSGRQRERFGRLGHGGGDDDHSVDTRAARTIEHRRGLGGIEVRVGVDHAGAGASMRGKSGAAPLMPEAASRPPAATRSHSTPSGWPSASRMRAADTGRYEASATAEMRRPSASV